MPTNLFPHVYDQMIDEDIEWLKKNNEPCVERMHILAILRRSKIDYREYGYDQAMMGSILKDLVDHKSECPACQSKGDWLFYSFQYKTSDQHHDHKSYKCGCCTHEWSKLRHDPY